eukprot:Polyplicarium_translucidae@DN3326_c0_g6_i1.p2
MATLAFARAPADPGPDGGPVVERVVSAAVMDVVVVEVVVVEVGGSGCVGVAVPTVHPASKLSPINWILATPPLRKALSRKIQPPQFTSTTVPSTIIDRIHGRLAEPRYGTGNDSCGFKSESSTAVKEPSPALLITRIRRPPSGARISMLTGAVAVT